MRNERNRFELLPPEAALEKLIDAEKQELTKSDGWYGSGILPKAKLPNGSNITTFIEGLTQTQEKIRILEVGAGDDCGLWTGGYEASPFVQGEITPINGDVNRLRSKGITMEVTAHSARNNLKEWVEAHGVADFHSGHFVDVLTQLKNQQRKFDVILSR